VSVSPEPAHRAIARILAGGLIPRIRLDLNARAGTRSYAGFEDCDVIPSIGEAATVYEAETGIEGDATVTGIDEGKQLVHLAVDWASLREF